MGVTTIMDAMGDTMGPPAERLYPVDPVGVDTIIPSAPYRFKDSPFTEI